MTKINVSRRQHSIWGCLFLLSSLRPCQKPSLALPASWCPVNLSDVSYTTYERLFYVTNVEDSTYQYLNVYVPNGATPCS